ncbi:MAG: carboxypeptidase-like regulatory domain-containing protein, partial [Paludibacteraceae bacterium]|nr:carboxypeptidase-like regulatory domain-containing protein [Paludibacteraceae bacterium]
MRRFGILCIIWLAVALQVAAKHRVHGYVRAENGDLLPHVDVAVLTENWHTMTDSLGGYEVLTDNDSVWIAFSYVGYQTEKKFFSFAD